MIFYLTLVYTKYETPATETIVNAVHAAANLTVVLKTI